MNSENMKNRQRLLSLLDKVPNQSVPIGWKSAGTYSVGGLTEIGFSKTSDLLLVLSSAGRGVIDPTLGAVVARDEEPFGSWLNDQLLLCDGIGPLADETIQLAGLGGGGMPLVSRSGESIEAVSPHWPLCDLIFCSDWGSALIEGKQGGCVKITSDHIRAYGFSWTGDAFAYATGSEVTLFLRCVR